MQFVTRSKLISTYFFIQCLLLVGLINDQYAQTKNIDFVNPFIGTGGHGHTFPGAVLPFGMVQLSPDTRVDGSWDGCSGYHYSDTTIYGFSHTHLSGTGCSDWGDIMLMPVLGKISMDPKVYASGFNHKNEKASAGYYEVLLNKGQVKVELTSTLRVGIHRYTFPKTERANVILDLLHRDKTIDCGYKVVDSTTVIGYRISEAWAKEQVVYFAIRFSKPFQRLTAASDKKFVAKLAEESVRKEGACFVFDGHNGESIMVKVAISSVNEDGALKNLEAEAKDWNFENYKLKAEKAWEEQLKKIEISEENKDKRTVFYTAMYHCFIHPSLNMDVDGQYRGRDKKIHVANGFVNYSVFSLWDTYRALHPLFTILEKKRTLDFINSFLYQYKQSGRLPMWELSAEETDCMIGFHSVSVIADAFVKGISGFDADAVYDAMKAASIYPDFGIPTFNKKGFLQVDDESESVSKSLEYAYDNWCIAQMARKLGNLDDEKFYLNRSLAYKNLFDKSTGHMRPRKNGNWLSPFYANEINNHFTEGNSWQYSFYVPHDIEGLIALQGGDEKFEKKLDELFTTSTKTRGREQADVTGLIGQYAHGNEPSHHMAYLYNYVGKPQKTIEYTHNICAEFYRNSPDGLIGNDDCGQMSAWYVLSAIGFYPVCPGSPQYALSEPIFNSIKVRSESGFIFSIDAKPGLNKPVKSIVLNGKPSNQSFIRHDDLINGSGLEFKYSPMEGSTEQYGQALNNRPASRVEENDLIPAPLIHSATQVFKDKMKLELEAINTPTSPIYYTTDGSPVTVNSKLYSSPFEVDTTCLIRAKIITKTNQKSIETEARLFKLKYNYEITIKSKVNSQYAAEGPQTLVDGIRGDADWRKGSWLGYQAQDFEALVDLKTVKELSSLSLGCLQDTRSWIIFPKEISFYGSMDNKKFELLGTFTNSVSVEDLNVQNNTFTINLQQKTKLRYLKVMAKTYGKLPEWHQGAGGDAFIFVDELEIK